MNETAELAETVLLPMGAYAVTGQIIPGIW